MANEEPVPSGRSEWLRFGQHPVIVGIVYPLIVASILAISSVVWSRITSDASASATCQNPQGTPLARSAITATASSSHPDEGSLTYGPPMAIDGDTSTAWVEGSDGLGAGESIRLSFATKQDVLLVCAMNGYTSDQEHYERNGRIRDYATKTDRGSATGALDATAASFQNYQELKVVTGSTTELTVTIVNAVSGSEVGKQKAYDDTAVSDIIVYVK